MKSRVLEASVKYDFDTMTYTYGDEYGGVELIDHMGHDYTAVDAARISYGRDRTSLETLTQEQANKNDKLLKYLLDNKHTSPFEHAIITFKITTPLVISKQIMRHRTFSYNELSRRYTSRDVKFFLPKKIREQSKTNLQSSENLNKMKELTLDPISPWRSPVDDIEDAYDLSLQTYEALISAGVAREQARMVLPGATYTSFWMTGNLHNWIKFLVLRIAPDAQEEVRVVARAIYSYLELLFPKTMALVETRN